MTEELNRCHDQSDPEYEEHERERFEQGGPEHDENGAQHKRQGYANRKGSTSLLDRHGEARENHYAYEEIVYRKALLHDIAGEVFSGETPPARAPNTMPNKSATPM